MSSLGSFIGRFSAANNSEFFRASREDLVSQATSVGRPFWRKLAVGFVAAAMIGFDAVSGAYPF